MNPKVRIGKISLYNFRNHKKIQLSNLKSQVVLNGNNGSGKTNILEAISLFSPGRGLKNSSFRDIPCRNNELNSFAVTLNVQYEMGEIEIKKSYSGDNKKNNFLSVDGEKIDNYKILDFINILWITPIMEKVILQSNSEKRNFFDRLIFNINKNHLKNYSKLQKLLSERLALLKTKYYDKDWLNIIETNIAELSKEILDSRNVFINLLNEKLSEVKIPLSTCVVNLNHDILERNEYQNSSDFVEKYKSMLCLNRNIDAELNRTSKTINKVNIEIFNNTDQLIEARNSSTGEQKSILLSIFLSVAKIVKNKNNGRSPIILLDEAMAHLDGDHKEYLFDALSNLNSQVWLTGVSKDLFSSIGDQTVFFDIKNIV